MSFEPKQDETLNNSDNVNGQQNNNDAPFFQAGERVFKSQEDLARHIDHAQAHIKKLEEDFENASKLLSLQEQQLGKASKIDDILNAVAQQKTSGNAQETPKFSKEDIIAEALKTFEQRQIESTIKEQEEANYRLVSETLYSVYSDKTDEVVRKVAEENGMSFEESMEYARRYPKAFMKMFDTPAKPSGRPNLSSVNTQSFANVPGSGPRKSIMEMNSRERAAEVQRRLAELSK